MLVKGKYGTAEVDFGENTADAVEKFGEEVVFSNYKRAAVISAQGVIRALNKAGKSPADITEKLATWKPGVSQRVAADPTAKFKALIQGMDAEARAKLLAECEAECAGGDEE